MFCDRDILIAALSLQGSKGLTLSFLVLLFFSPTVTLHKVCFLILSSFKNRLKQ